jgi:K+-transporting ATPase ATPase A chain
MTLHGWLESSIFFLLLILVAKPLGSYMVKVYLGQSHLLAWLNPIERGILRLCGVRSEQEMDWKTYATSVLLFSGAGMVWIYLVQRLQSILPLNPRGRASVVPDLAFNTAASYVTNTNWQAYSGETTMSHLTQMVALTAHDFLSSAIGTAILIALIRGLTRRHIQTIGNFWVDLVRTCLYILLPIAVVSSLVLVSQGSVQTLAASTIGRFIQPPAGHWQVASGGGHATERISSAEVGALWRSQDIAVGPASTQVVARDLGTSGGGFFNANSAHPFESPTPFSDLFLLFLQTVIAAALTYTYGRMAGDSRQGWIILATMMALAAGGVGAAYYAEARGNPAIATLDVDLMPSEQQAGGNMEGKEVRFGIAETALVAALTTATSTGAANGMHDSLMPLGGFVTLFMMQLGEVALGGIGSGLSGLLVFAVIAAFIGGLMIGRTPEYLGKKLEPYDIKMAALIILVMPVVVLLFTAVAVSTETARSAMGNPGPHGFSEVLYAYTSMTNNNGSTFGGLNANTPFLNLTGAFAMLIGRYGVALPTLALAGSLARKETIHTSEGALPTHTLLFGFWLLLVVLGVGAMSFLPALALGPIAEHLISAG